eukprot:CAMPEP_0176074114 /NCGR_PEP_ID=MMETSP0120_2-20121206/37036_1 /TAXON_ID=160619 /ORGANISM="Kryptoperidinium foliaceum, Strain CCMP 1326" /LENGTH=176 /DNA_ID=CAMNT_0017407805 /DNA_START=69 /DNA_END=599 /DNA_ORIENTATION=+
MELRDYLLIKPEYLGPGFNEHCEDQLRQKVEGTIKEELGIVMSVATVWRADHGKLQDDTGLVMVPMGYTAVVMQLTKGEIVDCSCVEVTQLGMFGEVGPVKVFVSRSHLPPGWKYVERDVDSAGGAAYVSEEMGLAIRVKSNVRVRLIATKQDGDRMWAIGSCQDLEEPLLGPPRT